MSVEDEFCTVLTPDGEFLKARNRANVSLGEEFYFYPIEEIETKKPSFWSRVKKKNVIIYSTSVLAAVLLFISFLPMMLTSNKVYAYVSIDINPSVEIGINEHLDVISLVAMNDDGTKLLNNFADWKNKHIDTVTEAIIEKSMQDGFLDHDTKEVLITTIVNGNETKASSKIDQELEDLSEQYEKGKQIIVTTEKSNLEVREKARSQGISTGKLIQLEKQKEKELKNTVDTVPDTSKAEKNIVPAEITTTTKTIDDEKEKINKSNRNKKSVNDENNNGKNNRLENQKHNNGKSNKENKNNSNESNGKNKVASDEKKKNNALNRSNGKKKEEVKKKSSELDHLKSPRERLEQRLKNLPGNGRGNSNGNGHSNGRDKNN